MSFTKIKLAMDSKDHLAGMNGVIETVNRDLIGMQFRVKREHMNTVGLYLEHFNVEGVVLQSNRLIGGNHYDISTFLSGVYLGGCLNFREGYGR